MALLIAASLRYDNIGILESEKSSTIKKYIHLQFSGAVDEKKMMFGYYKPNRCIKILRKKKSLALTVLENCKKIIYKKNISLENNNHEELERKIEKLLDILKKENIFTEKISLKVNQCMLKNKTIKDVQIKIKDEKGKSVNGLKIIGSCPFEIKNITPGNYSLEFFHSMSEKKELQVNLLDDDKFSITLEPLDMTAIKTAINTSKPISTRLNSYIKFIEEHPTHPETMKYKKEFLKLGANKIHCSDKILKIVSRKRRWFTNFSSDKNIRKRYTRFKIINGEMSEEDCKRECNTSCKMESCRGINYDCK